MAFDLIAHLSLNDNMTGPLRRVDRMLGSVGSSIGRLSSKMNPLSSGFIGIAAAASSAYGAVKIFNATVGEAMKMEQSEVIIGAMFDNKKLSDSYMKMMDEMAVKSPIFNSQDMYNNSKMYVSRTKDVKQLEKMWKVTERLAAANPLQGTEGAVFSLNELLSGDTVSMVDRFGLDKNVLAGIKKLSLDKQITEMDKYLERIGFTNELIEKMGNTSLGLWGQVKERSQTILRTMGEPALKAVSKFMNDALGRLNDDDMNRYAEWGGKVINNMVTGLSNNAIKLYDWFTGLTNSSEFQSKTTLTGKINFVVEDIASRLIAWYDGGGKDRIESFGSSVAQVMVAAMDSTDEVFALGEKLGKSVWTGVIDGIKKSAAESPVGSFIDKHVTSRTKWNETQGSLMNRAKGSRVDKLDNGGTGVGRTWGTAKPKNSHSGGLDRVPYSGYQATLHKDEKVLTAQQAREHRDGSGGNGGVVISGNTFHVREESDIEAIALKLARMIEIEGGQLGRYGF